MIRRALDSQVWRYTRTYSDDGPGLTAEATIVLQEVVLVVRLASEDADARTTLAAAWMVLGHTPSSPCMERPVTGTIQEDCRPWHARTHFIPDFARPLVPPSYADDRFEGEIDDVRRDPIETIVEDGRLIVVQDHRVYEAASPTEPLTLTVRHEVERIVK